MVSKMENKKINVLEYIIAERSTPPEYLDEAMRSNLKQVRIIHGKGTGVLREELQKLLRTMPGVASVRDEHIQFGGTGVTIVNFD